MRLCWRAECRYVLVAGAGAGRRRRVGQSGSGGVAGVAVDGALGQALGRRGSARGLYPYRRTGVRSPSRRGGVPLGSHRAVLAPAPGPRASPRPDLTGPAGCLPCRCGGRPGPGPGPGPGQGHPRVSLSGSHTEAHLPRPGVNEPD